MRRRPIGQILVERNEISEAELAAALAEQERTGLRLCQILIETGRISWLALARAIAEQVLDIEDAEPEPEAAPPAAAPEPEPPSLHLEPKRPVAEPPRLPPIPQLPNPSPPPALAPPSVAPVPEPVQIQPTPVPDSLEDPNVKLHSVEAMLRERQRAFIELVTTTETLRMKVARLEEIIEERDRELAKLRIARAV
jgi:outer membrane biosynthesis protein TonB